MLGSSPPLIEHAADVTTQLQVNGFDLTVRDVLRLTGAGSLGFRNDERQLSPSEPIEFDEQGWAHLPAGCYKIVFGEVVNLPLDVVGIALPRSSLLRMGASVETAYWDAGYHGRGESLLVVHNSAGLRLKRGARMVQIAFLRLGAPPERGYEGQYLGENVPGKATSLG